MRLHGGRVCGGRVSGWSLGLAVIIISACGGGAPTAPTAPADSAWPTADPQRYSVAVAQLQGDDDRSMKHVILQALVDMEATADLQGMQILDVPAAVDVPVGADAGEAVRAGHERARAMVGRLGATVLVWGQVLHSDRGDVVALYMTSGVARAGEMRSGATRPHRTPGVATAILVGSGRCVRVDGGRPG